jgi:hypothetical protein
MPEMVPATRPTMRTKRKDKGALETGGDPHPEARVFARLEG